MWPFLFHSRYNTNIVNHQVYQGKYSIGLGQYCKVANVGYQWLSQNRWLKDLRWLDKPKFPIHLKICLLLMSNHVSKLKFIYTMVERWMSTVWLCDYSFLKTFESWCYNHYIHHSHFYLPLLLSSHLQGNPIFILSYSTTLLLK